MAHTLLTPAQQLVLRMELAKTAPESQPQRLVLNKRSEIEAVVDAVTRGWCQLVVEGAGDHVVEDESIGGRLIKNDVNLLPEGQKEAQRLLYKG